MWRTAWRKYERAAKIMLIPGALFGAFMGIALSDIDQTGLTVDAVLTVVGWTLGVAAFAWLMMRLIGFRMAFYD